MSSEAQRGLPRAALVTLLLAACAGGGSLGRSPVLWAPGQPARISEDELAEAMADYASSFAAVVDGVSRRIFAESRDPEIRRRALVTKLRLVPLLQNEAFRSDAKAAFLGSFTLTVMMRVFLTRGEGSAGFGDLQEFVIDAARGLEGEIGEIGRRFLSAGELERVRADVEVVADRSLKRPGFSVYSVAGTLEHATASDQFSWLLDVPLSPVRALQGVSSGAAAVEDFNRTARAFRTVVDSLPEQLLGEVQLLLLDLEEREGATGLLAALGRTAASAERMSAAVDRLPADLQALLASSRSEIEAARALIESARELALPVASAAAEVRRASASWEAILAPPGDAAARGSESFEIQNWESAAREIGAAAEKLHGLGAELRALLEDRELLEATSLLDGAMNAAEERSRGVVDAAAWRGAQLLSLAFALALVYRVAGARLARLSR